MQRGAASWDDQPHPIRIRLLILLLLRELLGTTVERLIGMEYVSEKASIPP
jgi:hypothetical protein